jgi:3D (Asp-Asp-Asp) domain-containing protein
MNMAGDALLSAHASVAHSCFDTSTRWCEARRGIDASTAVDKPEGTRLIALGTRLIAVGTRLIAVGTRLIAVGTRLIAVGTRLIPVGTRLSGP